MGAIIAILANLSFLGLPLIIVAVLAIIGGVVLNFVQKRVEAETDEDDPDDDPAVRRVSGFRKLALWGGFVLGILGAVFLSAPQWATII